jgi:hypothetical protein
MAVSRNRKPIHIPLKEDDAIRALFKVKPTMDMPRPEANPTKPKGKCTKRGLKTN